MTYEEFGKFCFDVVNDKLKRLNCGVKTVDEIFNRDIYCFADDDKISIEFVFPEIA